MKRRSLLSLSVLVWATMWLAFCSGCGEALPPDTWFDPSQVVKHPKNSQSPVSPIWDRFGSADQTTERIPGSQLPRPEDLQYSDQDYAVGPSDVLRISVMDLFIEGQEAVLEKQVSQSGYIEMPLLEQRVKANGLTQDQLAVAIKKAYEPDILRDATVAVTVIQPRQNIFSILGAINRPGTYSIARTEFTLLEALALAGDISQPNIEWIYVIRNQSRQPSKAQEKPVSEELPPLPKIPAKPSPSQPAAQPNQPASGPGQEGPNLQEQLKDLERLIPGASANPRRTPGGKARVQPIYLSSTGGDVADSTPASGETTSNASPASAQTGQISHPAWQYVRGRWVSVQGGATQSAPANEEATAASRPAGGEDPYGWKKYTYSDQVRIIAINLSELKSGEARLNVIVRNQDIIQVPTLDLGYFYVMGEVSRPGVYDLRGQRITVKEAVAAAGNLGPLSWPSNTILYRRVARDQEQMIPLDLNAIFQGREPDIFLKPDDVVAVGSNWIAPFMAVWRNAFRLTYGFGFVYDRNYSDKEFEIPILWPRAGDRPAWPGLARQSAKLRKSTRTMTDSSYSSTPAAKNLADLVQDEPVVPFLQAFPHGTLLKVGVLAGLFFVLQYRFIWPMVNAWETDPNWSHGFIIPLFSLYLLFSRREELKQAKRRVCWVGLPLVILGLTGEFLGIYTLKNYWISQLCVLLVLFGLVLYLAGPSIIRITWLPILFLIFAIPLPEMLYNRMALPLQNVAARGSMLMLKTAGVDITNDASALHLISRTGVPRDLTVAEACSGMHLLMAFLALGVAMAYLDDKPLWQRVILVCAGVPIAIFCNVLRVAITAWMFYIDKPEMGEDFMHKFTGVAMLVPALAMLWLLAWMLKLTLVEVEQEDPSTSAQVKG